MLLKQLFRKIFSPLIWGNFLAMAVVAVGVVVGLWYFLASYTHHGERVEVPEVKGMPFHDAEYALKRSGLKAVVADSAYNRTLTAGTILEQLPASGKFVKTGREIQLIINSSQTPTLTVPDIADNCSLREAEAKLKSMGFKLGAVEYVTGDRDWVYGVKCRGRNVMAGDRVPIDALLVLVVGNNAEEEEAWGDTIAEDADLLQDSITEPQDE